jgi:hypothetical protein
MGVQQQRNRKFDTDWRPGPAPVGPHPTQSGLSIGQSNGQQWKTKPGLMLF